MSEDPERVKRNVMSSFQKEKCIIILSHCTWIYVDLCGLYINHLFTKLFWISEQRAYVSTIYKWVWWHEYICKKRSKYHGMFSVVIFAQFTISPSFLFSFLPCFIFIFDKFLRKSTKLCLFQALLCHVKMPNKLPRIADLKITGFSWEKICEFLASRK